MDPAEDVTAAEEEEEVVGDLQQQEDNTKGQIPGLKS